MPETKGASLDRDISEAIAAARRLAQREGMFPPGDPVLVMLSGGQDSLALLHLLVRGALTGPNVPPLTALHVNYALRGEESEADQAVAESYCRLWGVPLEVRRVPLEKHSGNLQERARLLRREAARDLARRLGAPRIALGHTLDDQVETIFYRLGRYGGLAALAGMRPVDLPWVRPLLEMRRVQTEAYCRAQGIDFAVDRGNRDPAYARTALRETVLPAWERALPGAAVAAGRAAEVAAEAAALLESVLERLEDEVRLPGSGDPSRYSVTRLLALTPPERRALLRRILQHLGGEPSRAAVLDLEAVLYGGGSAVLDVGGGWRASRVYGTLAFAGADVRTGGAALEGAVEPVPLLVPGEARWGGATVTADFVPAFLAPDTRREAYVDARALAPGLIVRGFRPGDRFRPLGAPGSRKLKEVLIDLRVPAARRRAIPLVFAGDDLLWVGGYALGEQGRIRPDTEQVVRLAIEGVAAEDEDPYHGR